VTRAFLWITLVLATLVVVGIVLQVYFIAAYIFGAGQDALDVHEGFGNAVHGIEVLTFLAMIGAFWRRWWDIGLGFALAAIGTVQIAFTEGDEAWVNALHGLFAMMVFVLAAIIAHRAMRGLGLGRHGEPESA
jgi:hypothetical protein